MTSQIAVIVAGAFVGAVITGGAGFAFAIVATIVWVHVLTPPQTVMLAAACASTIHIASIWHFRKDIDYRRLWPFVLGAVFGAPLGVYALKFIRAEQFRIVVGVIIVAYALFIAFRPKLHRIHLSEPAGKVADAAVGWASGILGGASLLHGILPTIWCVLRGWEKAEARAIYQPYIMFTGLYVMLLAGINIRSEVSTVAWLFVACLPALAAGFFIGMRIFNWMSEKLFMRLVLGFVFVSGVLLLADTLF